MQHVPEEKRFKHKCYLLLLVTLSPTRKTTKPPALTQHEQKEKNYYVTGLSKWRKYSAWKKPKNKNNHQFMLSLKDNNNNNNKRYHQLKK